MNRSLYLFVTVYLAIIVYGIAHGETKPGPLPPAVTPPAKAATAPLPDSKPPAVSPPPVTRFILPNGQPTDSAEVFALLNQQKQQFDALVKEFQELQRRFWALFDFLLARGQTPPTSVLPKP